MEPVPPRLDVTGAASVTAGLTLLVYGITRVEEAAASPQAVGTLISLSTSVVPLALFAWWLEGWVPPNPFVPLGSSARANCSGRTSSRSVLPRPPPRPCCSASFTCSRYLGFPPGQAGLVYPPFNLAVIGGSLLGPRLVARMGQRATMVCGLVAIAAGSACLLRMSPHGGGYLLYLIPAFVWRRHPPGIRLGCLNCLRNRRRNGGLQGLTSGLLSSTARWGPFAGLAILIPPLRRPHGGPRRSNARRPRARPRFQARIHWRRCYSRLRHRNRHAPDQTKATRPCSGCQKRRTIAPQPLSKT